jgi:hypothetical protein
MNLIVPVPSDAAAAIELADTLLRTAVGVLYQSHGDSDFPEHYVRSIATARLAGELHALRCLETTDRRNQLAERVNRLRSKVNLPPTSWDEIVGGLSHR